MISNIFALDNYCNYKVLHQFEPIFSGTQIKDNEKGTNQKHEKWKSLGSLFFVSIQNKALT